MYSPNYKSMPSLSVKAWDADLVAVELVGLLAAFSFFVDVVLIGETACVPHVPYVKTEDFVQATAYLWLPASNRSMQIYPKF